MMETTMVVVADDDDHAYEVAQENYKEAFSDSGESPSIAVEGEVSNVSQLRDGWDSRCVPYGGDGNARLGELLAGA